MSTHQAEIDNFGLNWLGKNHDIYKSSSGKFYNAATELPPLGCFNCHMMHWRKDCPHGILHGSQKEIKYFKISKVVFDIY